MGDLNFPGWQPEKSINVITADWNTRVFVKGRPYMSWQSGDEGCLAIVQLHACGLGTEEELAHAFGRHVNSVQRYLAEFAGQGMRGLVPERRGPKGPWKLTPELRGKILFIVLREGICKLEAIQQRVAEVWQEVVSVPTIRQVLEENGLSEQTSNSLGDGVIQAELFGPDPTRQLLLNLNSEGDQSGERSVGSGRQEPEGEATGEVNGLEEQTGVEETGRSSRRHYSPAQRVYLDQLEQGTYNAYAGGLLFTPLLTRYGLLPTLQRVITIPTYEGYSLEELALTLFYLDVFGFRSLEDFKRAYPEEFGVLVGRTQSPSLFTLRRFLNKVRKLGRGEALMDEFAVTYLKSELAAWGVRACSKINSDFLSAIWCNSKSEGLHACRG